MDATRLEFPDRSFDAVVDKGTLDALCCAPGGDALAHAMNAEVARVLRPTGVGDPGGGGQRSGPLVPGAPSRPAERKVRLNAREGQFLVKHLTWVPKGSNTAERRTRRAVFLFCINRHRPRLCIRIAICTHKWRLSTPLHPKKKLARYDPRLFPFGPCRGLPGGLLRGAAGAPPPLRPLRLSEAGRHRHRPLPRRPAGRRRGQPLRLRPPPRPRPHPHPPSAPGSRVTSTILPPSL